MGLPSLASPWGLTSQDLGGDAQAAQRLGDLDERCHRRESRASREGDGLRGLLPFFRLFLRKGFDSLKVQMQMRN